MILTQVSLLGLVVIFLILLLFLIPTAWIAYALYKRLTGRHPLSGRRRLVISLASGAILLICAGFLILIFSIYDFYELFPIGYEYSQDQDLVLEELGRPDAFAIVFSKTEAEESERLETWYFYDYEIALDFVNGRFQADEDIEPLSQAYRPTPYEPRNFNRYMTRKFVTEWLSCEPPRPGRRWAHSPPIRIEHILPELFQGLGITLHLYEQVSVCFDTAADTLLYVETNAVSPAGPNHQVSFRTGGLRPSRLQKMEKPSKVRNLFALIPSALATEGTASPRKKPRTWFQRFTQPAIFLGERFNQFKTWATGEVGKVKVFGKPVGKKILAPALKTQMELLIPPVIHQVVAIRDLYDRGRETKYQIKEFNRVRREVKESAADLRELANRMEREVLSEIRRTAGSGGTGEVTPGFRINVIRKANDAKKALYALADHIDKAVGRLRPEKIIERVLKEGLKQTVKILDEKLPRLALAELRKRATKETEKMVAHYIWNKIPQRERDVLDKLLRLHGTKIKPTVGPQDLLEAIRRGKFKELAGKMKIKWGPKPELLTEQDFNKVLKELIEKIVADAKKELVKEVPEQVWREELKGFLISILPDKKERIEEIVSKLPRMDEVSDILKELKKDTVQKDLLKKSATDLFDILKDSARKGKKIQKAELKVALEKLKQRVKGLGKQERLQAKFTAGPQEGKLPLLVNFNASGSLGDIREYRWDFGDDEIGNGKTTTHKYQAEGQYTAKLTIFGQSPTDSHSATVKITVLPEEETSLEVSAGVNPIEVERGGEVDISAEVDLKGVKEGLLKVTFLIDNKLIKVESTSGDLGYDLEFSVPYQVPKEDKRKEFTVTVKAEVTPAEEIQKVIKKKRLVALSKPLTVKIKEEEKAKQEVAEMWYRGTCSGNLSAENVRIVFTPEGEAGRISIGFQHTKGSYLEYYRDKEDGSIKSERKQYSEFRFGPEDDLKVRGDGSFAWKGENGSITGRFVDKFKSATGLVTVFIKPAEPELQPEPIIKLSGNWKVKPYAARLKGGEVIEFE